MSAGPDAMRWTPDTGPLAPDDEPRDRGGRPPRHDAGEDDDAGEFVCVYPIPRHLQHGAAMPDRIDLPDAAEFAAEAIGWVAVRIEPAEPSDPSAAQLDVAGSILRDARDVLAGRLTVEDARERVEVAQRWWDRAAGHEYVQTGPGRGWGRQPL